MAFWNSNKNEGPGKGPEKKKTPEEEELEQMLAALNQDEQKELANLEYKQDEQKTWLEALEDSEKAIYNEHYKPEARRAIRRKLAMTGIMLGLLSPLRLGGPEGSRKGKGKADWVLKKGGEENKPKADTVEAKPVVKETPKPHHTPEKKKVAPTKPEVDTPNTTRPLTRDTIASLPTHKVDTFPVQSPVLDTIQPSLDTIAMPPIVEEAPVRHAKEKISPLKPTQNSPIPTTAPKLDPTLQTRPLPELPSFVAEEDTVTKIEPKKDTAEKLPTWVHPVNIPIEKLQQAPIKLMPFETHPVTLEQMKVRDVGTIVLPTIKQDTLPKTKETVPTKHTYPEGTVPPRNNDVIDNETYFDFNELEAEKKKISPIHTPKQDTAPVTAQTPAPAVKPEHKSKMKVTLTDKDGNVIDTNAIPKNTPGTKRTGDSIKITPRFNVPEYISDSTYNPTPLPKPEGLPEYTQIVVPGAEKYLVDRLPDTTSANELGFDQGIDQITPGWKAQKLLKPGEYLKLDKYGEYIPGWKMSRNLFERIDKGAWEKLSKDLTAQHAYLIQVEQNEDIGPWMITSKTLGVKMLFNNENQLIAESPALLGTDTTDELNTFMGNYEKGDTTTYRESTPAGKYYVKVLSPEEKQKLAATGDLGVGHANLPYVAMLLKVNPDGSVTNQGIAMHGETSTHTEEQEKKLHTAASGDNEHTRGCERLTPDGVAEMQKNLHGRDHYLEYITSSRPNIIINRNTGELVQKTPAQIRSMMQGSMDGYWKSHPSTYHPITQVLAPGTDGNPTNSGFTRTTLHRPDNSVKISVRPDVKISIPELSTKNSNKTVSRNK